MALGLGSSMYTYIHVPYSIFSSANLWDIGSLGMRLGYWPETFNIDFSLMWKGQRGRAKTADVISGSTQATTPIYLDTAY